MRLTVAEAKRRICPLEFVQWLAWYELRAELARDGETALDRYQVGADAVLDYMDRELTRIAALSSPLTPPLAAATQK